MSDWSNWSKSLTGQKLSDQTPTFKKPYPFTLAHMWMAFEAGVCVGGALWMLAWVLFS